MRVCMEQDQLANVRTEETMTPCIILAILRPSRRPCARPHGVAQSPPTLLLGMRPTTMRNPAQQGLSVGAASLCLDLPSQVKPTAQKDALRKTPSCCARA